MRLLTTLAAFAAGAAAMYYSDPETGRRRRITARDKLNAASHDAGQLARAKGKRASDRLKGLVATGLSVSSQPRSDDHLRDRIRSRLGRLVSHPKAVDVTVREGRVRLGGHIFADEMDGLLREVSAMAGVHGIDNLLSAHESAGTVPELQGGRRVRRAARAGRPSSRPMLPLLALAAAPLALMLKAARRGSMQPTHAK